MSPFRSNLLAKVAIALGSLSLVEKELLDVQRLLTKGDELIMMNTIRGEEDPQDELPFEDNLTSSSEPDIPEGIWQDDINV